MLGHQGAAGAVDRQSETRLPSLAEKQNLLGGIETKDDVGDEGQDLVRIALGLSELFDQSILEFDVQIASTDGLSVVEWGCLLEVRGHDGTPSLARNSSRVNTREKSGKTSEQKNSCSIGVRAEVQSDNIVTS